MQCDLYLCWVVKLLVNGKKAGIRKNVRECVCVLRKTLYNYTGSINARASLFTILKRFYYKNRAPKYSHHVTDRGSLII